MRIYCTGCGKDVEANLVDGRDIYLHRRDLYHLNFYQCPICKSYVGTHKGTEKPLGVLATKDIMQIKKKIHALIDPLYKSHKISRGNLYRKISQKLGYNYHTGNIKSLEEGNKVYQTCLQIKNEVLNGKI